MTPEKETKPVVKQDFEYEISIKNIIRILFRRKRTIIITFGLFMIAAFFYISMITPMYSASVGILLSSTRKNITPYYSELSTVRKAQPYVTQGEIVKSRLVLKEVAVKLELDERKDEKFFYPYAKRVVQPVLNFIKDGIRTIIDFVKVKILGKEKPTEDSAIEAVVKNLKKNIVINFVEDSDIFYITVFDYDPWMAQRIANAVSRQYVVFDLQQQILNLSNVYGKKHPEIVKLKDKIAEMEDLVGREDVEEDLLMGSGSSQIVEPASLPLKSAKPRARLLYLLTALFALISGISISFLTEGANRTFKNPWEFEESTGIPVLGSVLKRRKKEPQDPFLREIEDKSSYIQSFERISEQIYLIVKDQNIKTILFTDISKYQNSAANSYNIAYLLSHIYEMNILLIELDLRNIPINQVVPGDNNRSLSEIIASRSAVEENVINVTKRFGVLVAREVTYNPLVLLTSEMLPKIITELTSKYDLIVINSPPLLDHKDPFILAKNVDGVLVSLEENQVKRENAENSISSLLEQKGRCLGAIFNNRTTPIPDQIYRRI